MNNTLHTHFPRIILLACLMLPGCNKPTEHAAPPAATQAAAPAPVVTPPAIVPTAPPAVTPPVVVPATAPTTLPIGPDGLIVESDNQHAPFMAVYKGSVDGVAKPYGIQRAQAYAAWLNRSLIWAEDTLPGDNGWGNVEGGSWQLEPWGQWVAANPARRVIWSVPIVPGAWDGSGFAQGKDAHQPISLELGAAGNFNEHYKKLAERLVKNHLENSILRLGWEFSGGWYAWNVKSKAKAAAYAGYWREIVKTMRRVPGTEKLQFDFNPASGWMGYDPEEAWPGDEYVDFVGPDIYDDCYAKDTYPWPKDATPEQIEQRHKKAWDEYLNGTYGLAYWSKFARKHHKPLTFPEWGVNNKPDHHGGGDNPYFIAQMYQFIHDPANNVYFAAYFDYNAGDGHHQLAPKPDGTVITEFPNSSKLFHNLMARPAPLATRQSTPG